MIFLRGVPRVPFLFAEHLHHQDDSKPRGVYLKFPSARALQSELRATFPELLQVFQPA